MRTLQLEVGKLTRVRGNKGSGQTDSEMYYVDTHNEVAGALLYLHDSNQPIYLLDANAYGRGSTIAKNALNVVWFCSPTELAGDLDNDGFVRITVDGQRLDLPEDEVRTAMESKSTATHTNWDKPNPRGGAGPYFEHLEFARMSSRLPVTWGPEADREPNRIVLEEHPGEWVVEYRHQGEVIRTWTFTVSADGTIQAHPEQASLSLPERVYFIESRIPDGGSPADARVVPAAVKRGRLYQPWATPEGRALADQVPSKGRPTP